MAELLCVMSICSARPTASMSDFTCHRTASDGNCQFAAVAFVVGDEADIARVKAVSRIAAHLKDFRDGILNSLVPDPARPNAYDDMAEVRAIQDPNQQLEAYLNKMGRNRTWGDQNTLRALAEVYGRPIDVFNSETGCKTTIPLRDAIDNVDPISLRYYQDNHYDALVPTRCSKQTSQPSESHEDRGSRKQLGKP